MKLAGICLCAASALALSACHRPQATAAAHPPVLPQAAAPKLAANNKLVLPIVAAAPASAGASAAGAAAGPAAHPTGGAHAKAAAAHTTRVTATGRHVATRHSTAKGVAVAAARPVETFATAGGASPAAVHADDRFSAEYESCMAAADGFTVARANCHSAELARQGARVDRALNAALAARSGQARTRLLSDQRSWVAARDAECQQDADRAGREVLHEGSCRLNMTVQRAIKLEHIEG
jgi:uncharacterized protein YecT (DUF1311 family)